MACYHPITGYRGKGGITFVRGLSLTGVPLKLPCGQCIGCRLERSRQWAMRCVHEAKFHAANCFVTLTYDNTFMPAGGSLSKRDLCLFFKRLRNTRGAFRYYACGEYGSLSARPHYHALVFGLNFPDKTKQSVNRRGDVYYGSAELKELWPYGNNIIGEVNFDTAAYVARYVMKKITGPMAESHYDVMDGNGEIHRRIPEFTVMSRRPGIGLKYYETYGQEVRDHDSVVINGREVLPPRYYDKKTEEFFPEVREKHLRKRRKAGIARKADNTPDRLSVREEITRRNLERKGRSL